MKHAETLARDGSKTARKTFRRMVRKALGTSSDPAPTVMQALDAADYLSNLLHLASGGQYALIVRDLTAPYDTGALRTAYTEKSVMSVPKAIADTRERLAEVTS